MAESASKSDHVSTNHHPPVIGKLVGVSHLLHMMFLPRLCGLLCHPCFVNPAMESPPAF